MKLFIVNGLYFNIDQDEYGPFVWTVECQNSEEAIGSIYKQMNSEYPSHRIVSIFARDISGVAHSFVNGGAARIEADQRQVPTKAGKHPSHVTRHSDASSYDEICVNCGATDISGGGWGKLAQPCQKSVLR